MPPLAVWASLSWLLGLNRQQGELVQSPPLPWGTVELNHSLPEQR